VRIIHRPALENPISHAFRNAVVDRVMVEDLQLVLSRSLNKLAFSKFKQMQILWISAISTFFKLVCS